MVAPKLLHSQGSSYPTELNTSCPCRLNTLIFAFGYRSISFNSHVSFTPSPLGDIPCDTSTQSLFTCVTIFYPNNHMHPAMVTCIKPCGLILQNARHLAQHYPNKKHMVGLASKIKSISITPNCSEHIMSSVTKCTTGVLRFSISKFCL